MRKWCFAFVSIVLAVTPGQGAEPIKAPQKVYRTGRVAPKNMAALRAKAAARQAVKALPRCTAPVFDCRSMGWVPPIVDQGDCGSCWDFSGCGVATSAFIKAGLAPNDGSFRLSEQYVLDCGSNGGCGGDDNTTVLEMASSAGLPNTSAYGPYVEQAQRCKGTPPLYKLTSWGFCDGTGDGVTDTQTIKNMIAANGPVGCAIAASNGFMNIQPGTVFQGDGFRALNHDVILIGWDDSKGAWLLRNSWGTGWADGGYCWIVYGANGVGTEAVYAVAGTVPAAAGCAVCRMGARRLPDGTVNWEQLIIEIIALLQEYFPPPTPATTRAAAACNCNPERCQCESVGGCVSPATCPAQSGRVVYVEVQSEPQRRFFRGRLFRRRGR